MYSIGEFSAKTGLTARTLRFYEEKGLLMPGRYPENQYRVYTEADLETALRIRLLKGLGIPLEEIGSVVGLMGQGQLMDALKEVLEIRLRACESELDALGQQHRQIRGLLVRLKDADGFSVQVLDDLGTLDKKERQKLMQAMVQHFQFSTLGRREDNEDFTWIRETPHGNLYLIADGMGGHLGTASASRLASETLLSQIEPGKMTPERYAAYLAELFQQANDAVFRHPEFTEVKGGTTLTLLVVRDNQAYIGHVGDTRVYRYHGGILEQLTQDHSVIANLLAKGEILRKDIPTHPAKNLIYSIVGYEPAIKEMFTACEAVRPQSVYLLVSDGITNTLADAEMAQLLRGYPLEEAIVRMKGLAEKHGEDNASAIGVAIP